MKYATLAATFQKLDATTKRLEMIDILIQLFQKTPKTVFRRVIYLTSGKIAADYKDVELGFADKMVIKAIAKAVGQSENKVTALFRKKGDLGEVAEETIRGTRQQQLGAFFDIDDKHDTNLTVEAVWEKLQKIAGTEGKGSVSRKTNYLLGLFSKASPIEAKYITRTVLSQLRLGVKDLTIIEALSRTFSQEKNARAIIEHAYNITSDIGEVGEVIATQGLEGIKNIDVRIGRPIRMMAAQRLASVEEILEKMGGKCALEFKYDGERVQVHIGTKTLRLFSRNLNDISNMYPDVQNALRESIKAEEVIIEGEITAWNPETEELQTFQTLMQRKRKYDIEKIAEKIPVKVFLFDILYKNGESLLQTPYPIRRKILETIIKNNKVIMSASQEVVSSPKEFEEYFEKAVQFGCEGIMAKDIREETPYQAGNRGFLWIKHKFDYTAAFADTFDFAVVGGFYGKGRRKGTLGTLLMATYDPISEKFETVCKLGSGFTDQDLEQITKELLQLKTMQKPKDVNSKIEPDIWIVPEKVFEIQGADLSLSPVHTCALDELKKDHGIAIRFPRFIRFRNDKKAEYATTTKEVMNAYKKQRLQK